MVVHSGQHSCPLEEGVASAEFNQTTPKNLTEKPQVKQGHSLFFENRKNAKLMSTANHKPVNAKVNEHGKS